MPPGEPRDALEAHRGAREQGVGDAELARARALVERLLPSGLVEYERRAVIHMRGVFTPYPFQANTHGLPREIVLENTITSAAVSAARSSASWRPAIFMTVRAYRNAAGVN